MLKIDDVVRLKPGASTYTGEGKICGFETLGILVLRPDGSMWLWPTEWILVTKEQSDAGS